MNLSKVKHLTKEDIIKNGSVFTPESIVEIAVNWLKPYVDKHDKVIDFGCGYGAFISKFINLSNNCIATDMDKQSIDFINQHFPKVQTYLENSLVDIDRKKYRIDEHDRVFIIGNPPYNDLTSQFKKGQKGEMVVDPAIKARDLGMAFLNMYALLSPKFICVLHPLSYLIKKTNYRALDQFHCTYTLKKGLVFSSKEFESINKQYADFPVVLALYERSLLENQTFEDILHFQFSVYQSKKIFIVSQFNTIDGLMNKYPTKTGNEDDLYFYTIRDINALIRNKTFIDKKIPNGVKVDMQTLYLYAWLDYFKKYAKFTNHYLIGNLSPLFSAKINDSETKKELICYLINSNEIVRNYYLKNNLYLTLLAHYQINKIITTYPVLEEILSSLHQLTS
jgi:predicted RNA methylase